MNLFIKNLSPKVDDEDIKKAFEVYGKVTSAKVIKDRFSGESRGFGFVEMPSSKEAIEAIKGLNSQEIDGQKLTVSEARPQQDNRRPQGGGGKRGGGNRRW